MSALSKNDWVNIHAKAFDDPKFRDLLEKDPTAAVRQWASETHRPHPEKIVDLSEWIKIDLDDWNHGPPSCC
jgi:hypothetical protein